MDWLTTEDWSDLRQMAVTLGYAVAGTLVLVGFLRWRRGALIFQRDDLLKMIENSWFFLFIVLFLPLSEMAERHGLGDFAAFGLLLALSMVTLIPTMYIGHRRMKASQVDAIDNPDATEAMPSVPPNEHEKQMGLKLTLAITAFAIVTIGPLLWLAFSGHKVGLSGAGWLLAYCLMILAVMTFGIVGRWPGSVSAQGSIEVNATPEQVWDAITYREGRDHYRGIFSRIERLNEPNEVYCLHYLAMDNCTECGLPRHPEAKGMVNRVEVIESRQAELYRIRSFPRGTDAQKGDASKWMAEEEDSFTLMDLGDGRCRVDCECLALKPRVWMAALIRFGNPIGEKLRNIKAHLEGTPDESIYATAIARIAAARAAPRHCGCQNGAAALAIA